MAEQLTGYEASSVVEVGAVLDDSPIDAEEVYLRTIGHSERAIAAVAAKRAGGGGGGSLSFNSAVIQLAVPPPLAVANNWLYSFQTADMTIASQTGTDFSIGEPVGGQPGILSEAGGVFQAGVFLACPQNATLDGGSSATRWLAFAAALGSLGSSLGSLGLDLSVPAYAGTPARTPDQCVASLPDLGVPGGYALSGISVTLRSGIGTDSVPLDAVFGWPMLGLWRIGT